MKRSNVVAIVLIIIVLAAVGINVYRAIRQGNTIEFDSRTLTDNLWGAPTTENLTSQVYLNKDQTFGWYWNRADPMKNPGDIFVRPIFPNVRIGADLGEKSNTSYFPLQVRDIHNLSFYVVYQYLTAPTGAYNLAYQMYFTDTDKPGPDAHVNVEVMIWLHHTFPQPPDTYKGDFSDGNNSYELWSWVMSDGRQYYSFLMKGQPLFDAQHTVDAKRLLDNLVIDPNLYLLGVHLGSEIVSGAGKIEIRKLIISLNGNQI